MIGQIGVLMRSAYSDVKRIDPLINKIDHPQQEYLYDMYKNLDDTFRLITVILIDIKKDKGD